MNPRGWGDGMCITSTSRLQVDDLVDQAVFQGLLSGHVVVTAEVLDDTLTGLPGHLRVHGHESLLDLEDLLRLHLNVLRLPLAAAHGLVDHHARVWQRQPLASLTRPQNERRHRRGHTHVDRSHLRRDVAHRVAHGEPRNHTSARAVHIQMDRPTGLLGFHEEHDSNDLVGNLVIHLLSKEDDSLTVQPVVDVNPLCRVRARDFVRHLGHADRHHPH
mmetsp:Transcript_1510/g.3890  ORF Transcript_1510/g.3890 Transcript_1510/m.3890 type:complete len:217 (-) Transcript_1510:114-764(-)